MREELSKESFRSIHPESLNDIHPKIKLQLALLPEEDIKAAANQYLLS